VFKNNDPDRDRAERKKLQHKHKKEMKGAIREIRKDNYYLEEIKQKKRQREEQKVKQKTKEIMTMLSNDQAQINREKRVGLKPLKL